MEAIIEQNVGFELDIILEGKSGDITATAIESSSVSLIYYLFIYLLFNKLESRFDRLKGTNCRDL